MNSSNIEETWNKILGYQNGSKVKLLKNFYSFDDKYISKGEVGVVKVSVDNKWFRVEFPNKRCLILEAEEIEGIE